MSDDIDIDIEEHDVLDNPRIKDMFPDITQIKKEIDDEEDDLDQDDYSLFAQMDESSNSCTDDDVGGVGARALPHHTQDEQFVQNTNKIILGTKPTQEINVEPWSAQDKINLEAKVILSDWRFRLDASPCYCRECKTLFATVNALDAHKMLEHSFLIALDQMDRSESATVASKPNSQPPPELLVVARRKQNVATKSTTSRPPTNINNQEANVINRNVVSLGTITKRTSQVVETTNRGRGKLCNHCDLYFTDDNALVKHLYELLPVKIFNCDQCDKMFNTSEELKVHSHVHVYTNTRTDLSAMDRAYVCKVCSVPFLHDSRFRKHMEKNHGAFIPTKRTPYTGKCGICSSEFKIRKYLFRHIVSVHSQHFNKKIGVAEKKPLQKNILMKNENESNLKYRCKICSQLLHNAAQARAHRLLKHPNVVRDDVMEGFIPQMFKCTVCNEVIYGPSTAKRHKSLMHPELKSHARIIVKITREKPKSKEQSKKPAHTQSTHENEVQVEKIRYKISNTRFVDNAPIPKSVIHKCVKCSLHFMAAFIATRHAIKCDGSKLASWRCDKCKRSFKPTDKEMHEIQHTICEKFKVYATNDKTYIKMLCECPDCHVYFPEMSFWNHRISGCSTKTKSSKCKECDIPLALNAVSGHDTKHKLRKYTKEDFIRLHYASSFTRTVVQKLVVNRKRSVDSDHSTVVPAKRRKTKSLHDELSCYYCPRCECYSSSKYRIEQHSDANMCANAQKQNVVCLVCGITLTASGFYKKHVLLHEKYENLSLRDMSFYKEINGEMTQINPPPPKYYPCNKCGVSFESKSVAFRGHCCDEVKFLSCDVCDINFTPKIYKLHMRFHEYAVNSKLTVPSSSSDGIHDLLMKYESLPQMWDILYLCESCDTVLDSYDRVIEHCQKHFDNMEHYGVTILKCKICALKFDSSCFERHKKLHLQQNVRKSSFKIVKYKYEMMLDNSEWINMLKQYLPGEQLDMILAQRKEPNAESETLTDNILYKCEKCQKYMDSDSVDNHFMICHLISKTQYKCLECDLSFVSNQCRNTHIALHKKYRNLKVSSFQIISFNLKEETFDNLNITTKEEKLYNVKKCVNCDTLIVSKYQGHMCLKKEDIRCCDVCGFKCRAKTFSKHKAFHSRNPNFLKQYVSVSPFTPTNIIYRDEDSQDEGEVSIRLDEEQLETKLFKCPCGLHFLTLNSIVKHQSTCNGSQRSVDSASREKCSKCGYLFLTDILVSHLCSHHSNNRNRRFAIEEVPFKRDTVNNITVYECEKCEVLFCYRGRLVRHLRNCSVKDNLGRECKLCGLNFHLDDIAIHYVAHSVRKLTADNFIIERVGAKTNFVVMKKRENEKSFYNNTFAPVASPQEDEPHVDNDANINQKTKSTVYFNREKALKSYHNVCSDMIFKCWKCPIYILKASSLMKHIAHHATLQTEVCDICNYIFTPQIFKQHKSLHHLEMNMTRDDLKVATKASDEFAENTTLYSDIKVIEGLCNVQELVRGHDKNILYKCEKCNICFTNPKSVPSHYCHNKNRQHSLQFAYVCPECNIVFLLSNITEHYTEHHKKLKMKRGDFLIITVKETSDDIVNSMSEHKKLFKIYRCQKCNIHFTEMLTLTSHLKRNCQDTFLICAKCELKFADNCLPVHTRFHHCKPEYSIKSYDIITDIEFSEDDGDKSQRDENKRRDKIIDSSENLQVLGFKCKNCKAVFSTERMLYEHMEDCNNRIFKCHLCTLHFVAGNVLKDHVDRHDTVSDFQINSCDKCNLNFSSGGLSRHQEIHHELLGLQKATEFCIITKGDEYKSNSQDEGPNIVDFKDAICDKFHVNQDKTLYKCGSCHCHFMSYSTVRRHQHSGNHSSYMYLPCPECGLLFTATTLQKHIVRYHDVLNLKLKDLHVVLLDEKDAETKENNFSNKLLELPSTSTAIGCNNVSKDDKDTISNDSLKSICVPKVKLYKCAECNVYFLSHITCYKHTFKHTPMDIMEYIECKFCHFQFTLDCLKSHIQKHHSEDFNLEDVLIEEYHPTLAGDKVPKRNTYYAADREQIRQVSTTSDFNTSNDQSAVNSAQTNLILNVPNIQIVKIENIEINEENDERKGMQNNVYTKVSQDKSYYKMSQDKSYEKLNYRQSDEKLNYKQSDDNLNQGLSNDKLNQRESDDKLILEESNDKLIQGESNDKLNQGQSNDMLNQGDSDDKLNHGEGDNKLNQRQSDDKLNQEDSDDKLNQGKSDDNLNQGDSDDMLNQEKSNDKLNQEESYDKLNQRESDDKLIQGESSDKMIQGKSNDKMIQGESNAKLNQGQIDDNINQGDSDNMLNQEKSDDNLNQGDSDDMLNQEKSNDKLNQEESCDKLNQRESDDKLIQWENSDKMIQGKSNDKMIQGESNAKLNQGQIDDMLNQGESSDKMIQGQSNDKMIQGESNDNLNQGQSDDMLNQGGSSDKLNQRVSDNKLNQEESNDKLNQKQSDDKLNQGESDDKLNPGDSDDMLNQEERNDKLNQEKNKDKLNQEESNDRPKQEQSDSKLIQEESESKIFKKTLESLSERDKDENRVEEEC